MVDENEPSLFSQIEPSVLAKYDQRLAEYGGLFIDLLAFADQIHHEQGEQMVVPCVVAGIIESFKVAEVPDQEQIKALEITLAVALSERVKMEHELSALLKVLEPYVDDVVTIAEAPHGE